MTAAAVLTPVMTTRSSPTACYHIDQQQKSLGQIASHGGDVPKSHVYFPIQISRRRNRLLAAACSSPLSTLEDDDTCAVSVTITADNLFDFDLEAAFQMPSNRSPTSTPSLASSESSGALSASGSLKSVAFPDDPISEVRTRPRTESHEREDLFYSPEDISRFRDEYRTILREELRVTEPIEPGLVIRTWSSAVGYIATTSSRIKDVLAAGRDEVEDTSVLVDSLFVF